MSVCVWYCSRLNIPHLVSTSITSCSLDFLYIFFVDQKVYSPGSLAAILKSSALNCFLSLSSNSRTFFSFLSICGEQQKKSISFCRYFFFHSDEPIIHQIIPNFNFYVNGVSVQNLLFQKKKINLVLFFKKKKACSSLLGHPSSNCISWSQLIEIVSEWGLDDDLSYCLNILPI